MKYVKIVLGIFLLILLQRFCHNKTDGFALRKILSDRSLYPEWGITPPALQEMAAIKAALSQPYRYLGKGAQLYVFGSDDGHYVLKFFRQEHIRPRAWFWILPTHHREEKVQCSFRKLQKDFRSYKIAYETLKEETGLIYLHLNKSEDLHLRIPVYDKIGVEHWIELDEMQFILQKRAEMVYPTLANWIENGEIAKAKGTLTELVQILKNRFEKEIFDKDPDLNTNFGILDGHPIQIDVGRFRKDNFYSNKQVYKLEIMRITDNLKQWLEGNCPELSFHLQREIQQL
jgi:hypothetical protein